jgi:hypothetical protein
MGVSESLLVAGIVCIVAAVVGGGVKMLGAEMPVLGSFARQTLLFFVGLAFLLGSFMVTQPKPAAPASAAAQNGAQPAPTLSTSAPAPAPRAQANAPVSPPATASGGGCVASSPLDCLPRSSGLVNFRDPAAATVAAARNLRDALSTTEAAALAARDGASGQATRLCGIVASNDSSRLANTWPPCASPPRALPTASPAPPACRWRKAFSRERQRPEL